MAHLFLDACVKRLHLRLAREVLHTSPILRDLRFQVNPGRARTKTRVEAKSETWLPLMTNPSSSIWRAHSGVLLVVIEVDAPPANVISRLVR